ncbi:nucleoprotein TPR [Pseudohyphozyma bogoriensis]|nr:nucleoprotein TPR [Pseudohyphozyma bogoriensis]
MDGDPASQIALLTSKLEAAESLSRRQAIEAEESLHELQTKLAAAEEKVREEQGKTSAASLIGEEYKKKNEGLEGELRKEREDKQRVVESVSGGRKKEDELEREKRELLSVVERNESEKNGLEESLASLRGLYTSLQSSHSKLEANLQEATTTSRTSLLRIQTLTSTITSLEADKTFLTSELTQGRAEWSQHRRETHTTIVRLQTEAENAGIELRDTKSSLASLRTAHHALNERYQAVLEELKTVKEERDSNEGNFASEMGSMRRLVEMMEKREEERKKRLEEVEQGLEEDRMAREAREEELKEEVELERWRSDELEVKCAELREAIERGAASFRGTLPGEDVPGSPNGAFTLSPSAQIAVRGQKSGRSYAEVYGEYVRMQEELARERSETKRLGDVLTQVLGDIEERAPILKQQRVEYDRLSVEATQLAAQLAQAMSDRENAQRLAEGYRLDVDRLERDATLQSSQLRDLGRQVRTLLRQLGSIELNLSNPDEFDEEEAAIHQRALESSDTDAVVSAHLVTFKTINELQLQNQKLLKITREMGAQMERGEEDAIARRRAEENAAVQEAHELILSLKEEVESQRAKMEAYVRERDMFRRMLAQHGEGGGTNGVGGAGGDGETPRLLADVQANFDAYRTEIAIDTQRLREDLSQAQREANTARTDLAKAKAQSEFVSERLRLLNDNYALQTDEIKQLSKRASQLQENVVKQETANHKLTEDLLELRSTSDQLRHENTNLKSEREVWKSVENRLVEENSALSRERAHLADLMQNLQTMQNGLESSGTEARRRLEEQVARLDTQAQETDASRQLALRKELEAKTFQDRVDKLTAEHQETREALIMARAAKEHLDQRVADLSAQVTAREEKLRVYEGRTSASEESSQTREQQLEVTVAELRVELKTAQTDLENAKAHVQQYKAIAETEGDSLRDITATYDEFKAKMDGAVEEKQAEISSLQERLHSLTSDLTTANNQNSELHRQIDTERTAFEKERKTFEDGLVNLRSADQAAREAQLAAQDDVRRQAQLAKDAHEKYDREVVAHAEDIKRLSEIREELESVRTTIREYQTASEVATANLTTSEASWTRQKTTLEQEITDLKKRTDDLNSQNAILHSQLETFGSQAAFLQSRLSNATVGGEGEGAAATADSVDAITSSLNSTVDQLREVIRYLRREKEIVDLQLEFSKQEAARLRQQLEFTSKSLEESRTALTEERAKSGDAVVSSAQHAELLERIHTAKLLRESNQTLRDENEANVRKAAALDARLNQALAELDPLKELVQTLQAEIEAKEHNIKLLEEDNTRWKNRNQSILAKYERIDPEELQGLKEEVEALRVIKTEVDAVKAQLATALSEKATAEAKIAELEPLVESERTAKVEAQQRFKSIQVQAKSIRDTRDALQKELNELKEKTASGESAPSADVVAEKEKLLAEKTELANQITTITQEKAALEARIAQESTGPTEQIKELEEKAASAAAQVTKLTADLEALKKKNETLHTHNKKFFMEKKNHDKELEDKNTEIATLKKDFEEKNAETIQKAVDERVAAVASAPPLSEAQIAEAVQQRVAAAEATLAEGREAAIKEAVSAATTQLEADLAKAREELASAATAASGPSDGAELEKLKSEFEAAKKALEGELESTKTRLGEEAKAREKEVTERLTAEITKANASTSSTEAKVDIDALVQAKLASLETERTAAQKKAIDEAVQTALETERSSHAAALEKVKADVQKEFTMKNQLLQKQIANLKQKAAAGAGATPSALPTKPAPAASTSASASPAETLPPLVRFLPHTSSTMSTFLKFGSKDKGKKRLAQDSPLVPPNVLLRRVRSPSGSNRSPPDFPAAGKPDPVPSSTIVASDSSNTISSLSSALSSASTTTLRVRIAPASGTTTIPGPSATRVTTRSVSKFFNKITLKKKVTSGVEDSDEREEGEQPPNTQARTATATAKAADPDRAEWERARLIKRAELNQKHRDKKIKEGVDGRNRERDELARKSLSGSRAEAYTVVEALVQTLKEEQGRSRKKKEKNEKAEEIRLLEWIRGVVLHASSEKFSKDVVEICARKFENRGEEWEVDESTMDDLKALGGDFWAFISQFGKHFKHPDESSQSTASFEMMDPPKDGSRKHQKVFRSRLTTTHGYLDEITRTFDISALAPPESTHSARGEADEPDPRHVYAEEIAEKKAEYREGSVEACHILPDYFYREKDSFWTVLERFAGFSVPELLDRDGALDLYKTSNGFLGSKFINTLYDNLGLSLLPDDAAFLETRRPSETYSFTIFTHSVAAETQMLKLRGTDRRGTFCQYADLEADWPERRDSKYAMPDPELLRMRHQGSVSGGRKKEDELEREKRELLSVVERNESEKNGLEESLASLRGLYTSLQSSHSKLEANLQEATTTSRTSLLRIQTVTSTITSLEADKTFLTSELTQGRAEWSQHRRETHTIIVRLQTEAENAGIELRDTKSSLASLRTAHDALNERYQAVLEELKTVKEERDSNEGNFASEMGSMRRLVEMMEKREEERKKRLEEVEQGLEEDRMAREAREEELKEEVEIERRRSDELEVKCAELREAIERGAASFRGTLPGEDVPGSPAGAFTLSPSAQIAVRGQKSGRSYAEVYGEYVRMQEELARERSETKRLGDVLTQVLGDIEERAPILKQQRVEYDRLSVEATQLAAQLAQAMSDRENAQRLAEGYRLDVDRLERDATLQSSQLRDLGRQVRTLLRQLGSVELNFSNPDEFDEEEAAIQQRALESSDTDAVVSAHLVTFKTINELQLQNQKLLKITREMVAQMERGEEDAIARRKAEENAAVQEAHELILSLKEEVESQRAKMEAYVRERDMFRRMLAQHGEGGGTNGVGGAGGDGETPRLLADVQANFDAYRTEIAIDTQRLREDLSQAQREANTARTDLAKAKAQSEATTTSQRQQTDEIKQLSKRASQLQESVVKQETANHKLTEDLLELRSTSDQLRHENINLKSEREVWKSVENRLVEENSALSRERAHLADLMQNLQTMQNGLESSGTEARRRLEEQVARLDTQAQETDASRQLALRKELEAKTFQDRVDKLTAEHQETREALIMARAAKEHLDQRVADLSAQVTAREEKLRVYEGRTSASEESSQTREQQLEVTVAELRVELKTAQTDLETAKAHVQQYKAIAETEGDSLRDLTATYDEFKAKMGGAVEEKQAEISSLQERLHSLTSDLTTANNQNSELHRQFDTERTAFEKERKTFEDGLVNLRSADQAAREAQLAAQDDVRRQAQLAKDAHEKYDREVVAHAEDIKRLSEIREELDSVRTTIREYQTASEVATANLTTSEASWTRQKTTLEQEITDLKKRTDDLNSQNAILHSQLETFGSQAAFLQSRLSNATVGGEGEGAAATADSVDAITSSLNSTVDQLREVIRYLRREKEIVDLQLEFSKQEAARLRQQLEFTSKSLEESRTALTEERAKSGDAVVSSAQHAELLERIHTAKLLRESNQTLRDENEANVRKAAALDARLNQALAELDPLKELVQTLQAEIEAKEHNIKLLEEDNTRWKNRNQSILAKYERIDPEELQGLKEEVDALRVIKTEVDAVKAQLATALSEKATAEAKIAELEPLVESERTAKVEAQQRFKSIQVQAKSIRDTRDALQKELNELKEKTASGEGAPSADVVAEKEKLLAEKTELANQITTITQEKAALEARIAQESTGPTEQIKELEEKAASAAAQVTKLTADLEALKKKNETLHTHNKKFFMEKKNHDKELEDKNTEIATLKKDFEEKNAETIQKAVDERVAAVASAPPLSEAQIAEAVQQRVAAAEATLAEGREAAIKEAVSAATTQLEADLAKAREELASAATAASGPSDGAELEKLKSEFEAAKKALEGELDSTKTRLGEEAKAREKEITERLTAEITKANASTSSTEAKVDVDALVQAKLASLETERTAAQKKAIDEAVKTALETERSSHAAALEKVKADVQKEFTMKNQLLQKQIANLKQKAAAGAGATPSALPTKPAPAASTSASASPAETLPPLTASFSRA